MSAGIGETGSKVSKDLKKFQKVCISGTSLYMFFEYCACARCTIKAVKTHLSSTWQHQLWRLCKVRKTEGRTTRCNDIKVWFAVGYCSWGQKYRQKRNGQKVEIEIHITHKYTAWCMGLHFSHPLYDGPIKEEKHTRTSWKWIAIDLMKSWIQILKFGFKIAIIYSLQSFYSHL